MEFQPELKKQRESHAVTLFPRKENGLHFSPGVKFVIHYFHKGSTIYYSLASMVIRYTVLILKQKFFCIVLT